MFAWIDWFLTHGHRVTLAAPEGGSIGLEALKRKEMNFLAIDFLSPSVRNAPKYVYHLIRLYLTAIRTKTSIIHCNAETAYYLGSTVARLANVPIVTHFRFHFPAAFYTWIFGKYRQPDGVFYVSRALLDEEETKLDRVGRHIPRWVIPNCLGRIRPDISEQNPARFFKGKGIRITYLAPVQERKNQSHLFELDDALRRRGVDVQIISAGRAKEASYLKYCRDLMPSGKDESRVKFIGHVQAVFSLLAETDIVISLSRYETFGISNLEAMLLGIPVVYYDVPAIREVVGDGGFRVAQGDADAMAECIAGLAASTEERHRIGMLGRERAERCYAPDTVMPLLLKCYESVMMTENRGPV